jgi:hypothetical protein
VTEPLPDLETKLKGDVSGLIKSLAEARAALKAYQEESGRTGEKSKEDSKKSTDAAKDFSRLVTANMKDGQSALVSLQQEYDRTSAKVADFRKQFSQDGKSGVFGDLKSAEADLEKLKGYLTDAGQKFGSSAGKTSGDDFILNFAKSLGNLPLVSSNPYVAAAMVAAGVALAVPLVAALDGAISAGIGAGGIAIGIAAAARTPQVKDALAILKTEAGGVFTDIGKEFQGPVAAGIGDLTGMLKGAEPGLKSTFTAMAADARPLIDGLGGFVTGLLPGLEKAFTDSLPAVRELSQDLPQLGADIGQMLDEFASGGAGANQALHDLLATVGDLAIGIGKVFEVGAHAYGELVGNLDLLTGQTTKYQVLTGQAKIGMDALHTSTNILTGDVDEQAKAYDYLNTKFTDWITSAEGADNALLALDTANLTANKELQKGTKYWNENTAAGQKQVGNLNNQVQALTHYYDTLKVNGVLTDDQTRAELKSAEALLATRRAAGATGPELATLQGIVDGLTASLNSIPANKTAHVTVDYTTKFLNEGTPPSQYMHGAANSGIRGGGIPHFDASGVYAGGPQPLYRFAEQSVGDEALIARRGDKNRALSALGEAASWFADDLNVNHNVNTSGGGMSYGVAYVMLDSKVLATALIQPVNRMNGRSSTSVYGVH